MSRITRAWSNSIDPFENRFLSSKKLEWTSVTDKARIRQSKVRNNRPSSRSASRVTEYPRLPPSKNADASATELEQEEAGNLSALSPTTLTDTVPSSDRMESSMWPPMSKTEN